MGGLFSSGGSRQNTVSTSGFQNLPGFGQDAFRDLVRGAQGFAIDDPSIFAPSDFNAMQMAGLNMMQAPQTAEQYQQALAPYTNAFLGDVIGGLQSDLMENFNAARSGIGSAASQAGAFGSTRQGVMEAEALGQTQDAFAREAGRLRAQNFADAGNMFRQDADRQFAAGSRMYDLAEQQRLAPITGLEFLANILQGSGFAGFGRPTTDSSGSSRNPGALASPEGIGGTIMALGTLFSDERLKGNIDCLGDIKGLPVYSFRYLWDGDDTPLREGVMAQDVEEMFPDAVKELLGFKLVDYSKLSEELGLCH